uniref:Uncharacterized protein n=1 Tax=Anguilla anguilla TaxID=7936 RepID=A0A0E9PYP9_ANGAN
MTFVSCAHQNVATIALNDF